MWTTALVVTSLLTPAAGVEFTTASFGDSLTRASKEGKLVFVDFYTDW